ncbi:MAG: hypothetical protein D6732_17035 [Methanobacteriota archaeon]|nr:MAG: hypothetical protein D6732_17035 [Euryarchaeota archaeon]
MKKKQFLVPFLILTIFFGISMPASVGLDKRPLNLRSQVAIWVNGTDLAISIGADLEPAMYLWNATDGMAVDTPKVRFSIPPRSYILDLNPTGTASVGGTTEVIMWKFSDSSVKKLPIYESLNVSNILFTSVAWGDNIYLGTDGLGYSIQQDANEPVQYLTNESESVVLQFDPTDLQLTGVFNVGSAVTSLEALADGGLAIGLKNGSLLVRDNEIFSSYSYKSTINVIKWQNNALYVAEGNRVHIIDNEDVQTIQTRNEITAMVPSPDGQKIAVGYTNETVDVYFLNNTMLWSKSFGHFEVFQNPITYLDWKDDKLLISKKLEMATSHDANTGTLLSQIGIDTNITIMALENHSSNNEITYYPNLFFAIIFILINKRNKKLRVERS